MAGLNLGPLGNIVNGALGGVTGLLGGVLTHGVGAVTGILSSTVSGAVKGATTGENALPGVIANAGQDLTPLGKTGGTATASTLPATSSTGDTELDSVIRKALIAALGAVTAMLPLPTWLKALIVGPVVTALMAAEHQLTHHTPQYAVPLIAPTAARAA